MESKRPYFFLAFVVGLALLACNMFVQSRLDDSIRVNQLIDEQFVDGAPPMVAFTTIALGGFRGLVADFLWLRASALQDQGKYFEMVQLASWIMKLQPKSTATAAYLGWNMAYNISVTYSLPQDRWRWVNKGIELYLEALNYNPNDPTLYKELGWIYQHKLGNVLDDAQRYYKYQMALGMMETLGSHYPDWNKLAAAPKTENELFAGIKDIKKLQAAFEALQFKNLDEVSTAFRKAGGNFPPELAKKLEPADVELMTRFFRVNWLKERFALDPARVAGVNKKYGDLDWFLPESFAIYYAKMGIEKSPGRKSLDCDRMITQSLQVTFTNGRMLLANGKPSMDFMLIPNLSTLTVACDAFEEAEKNSPDVASFKHAYDNFLARAVATVYSFGQYTLAERLFKLVNKRKPGTRNMTLDQFAILSWLEEVRDAGFKQAQDFISSLITRSVILLAYGDVKSASGHLKLAELVYNKFMSGSGDVERVRLPPFDTIKAQITKAVYDSFPPELQSNLKAQLIIDSGKAQTGPKMIFEGNKLVEAPEKKEAKTE